MDFVAIDFETAKYSQESACSIGLVKYEAGAAVDSYYSLVRPPVLYVRPDFTAIHGLTVNDIKDAPTFADIFASKIKPFIGSLPLAAHNAAFDMGVLRAVLEWYDIPAPNFSHFCTCNLARRTWRGLKSYSLTALGAHFGIVYEAHNALADAETCGKLALYAAEKFSASSVTELVSASGIKLNVLG